MVNSDADRNIRSGTGLKTGRSLTRLVVRPAARIAGGPSRPAHLRLGGGITLPCTLGAAGVTHRKREGDRATPAGSMPVLFGYYRDDRWVRPACLVPLRRLTRGLGWCDDAGSPLYNRPTPLPMRATHETMWRDDGLYDVVMVLGYNIWPRRAGRGSAIFLHCAKPGLVPTLGCVALRLADMRRLLPRLGRRAVLTVL